MTGDQKIRKKREKEAKSRQHDGDQTGDDPQIMWTLYRTEASLEKEGIK